MVLIRIDVANVALNGTIVLAATPVLKGEDYARYLCRWVSWASRVSSKLTKYIPLLRLDRAFNSWLSKKAFATVWKDIDAFEARPSFYNPIRCNKQEYIRICGSFWTGNVNAISINDIVHTGALSYLRDWQRSLCTCRMPSYGVSLHSYRSRISSFAELREILLQLLEILNTMTQNGFVHCDVRPPNVIIRKTDEELKVYLIDFDLATLSVAKKTRERQAVSAICAPDRFINSKMDVWSFGVMLLDLVGTDQSKTTFKQLCLRLTELKVQKSIMNDGPALIDGFQRRIEVNVSYESDRADEKTLTFLAQLIRQCLSPVGSRLTISELLQKVKDWHPTQSKGSAGCLIN